MPVSLDMKRPSLTPFIVSFITVLGTLTAHSKPIALHIAPRTTNPNIREIDNSAHLALLDPDATARNQLVVFLPGTDLKPSGSMDFLRTAAAMGFHTIGLMYENEGTVGDACADQDDAECSRAARIEIIEGINTTTVESIDPANSIVGRLTSLLSYLQRNAPEFGWDQYMNEAGNPRWDKIIISGFSQGAGHAAMIAKTRVVARCLMFSGSDWDKEALSSSTYEPGKTPPSQWYDFTHLRDLGPRLIKKWEAYGLTELGEIVFVEEAGGSPFRYSHTLTSDLPTGGTDSNNYHKAVVVDRMTPRDTEGVPLYQPVWEYMLAGPEKPTALPQLAIKLRSPDRIEISWDGTGYKLETSSSLLPDSWQRVPNNQSLVVLPRTFPMQYFRLTSSGDAQDG